MSASTFASVVLLAMLVTVASAYSNGKRPLPSGLFDKFYDGMCAQDPEKIIKDVVEKAIDKDITLAASLLRMHFHDSFVRGADASVLLISPNNDAERDAFPNLSLRGFEVIDAAKKAVEKACPKLVSCADILALAARDAVEHIGGPTWFVPTGRRDGLESHASETIDLPTPFSNITQLIDNFAKKGLNSVDLVVLSGAHTIGRSHCATFASRLYDTKGNPIVDPTLDRTYAKTLRRLCPPNSNGTILMDYQSGLNFDQNYFNEVKANRGLFTSDAALLKEHFCSLMVDISAGETGGDSGFFARFANSMLKMGQIDVLTGDAGEIRKKCYRTNHHHHTHQ